MDAYQPTLTTDAQQIDERIGFQWFCRDQHEHTIDCLWVWHWCTEVLPPRAVTPDAVFGWRPTGVRAHTLVQRDPLTITASVYWPDCCGLHGFITDGQWVQA